MKKELRNTISRQILKAKISSEDAPRVTLSFYRYVKLAKSPDAKSMVKLRDQLYEEWTALGVRGRIYLAQEGINAQLDVPQENLPALQKNLESRKKFAAMPIKIAVEDGRSFIKLTIKVKKQIVADFLPAGSYDVSDVGQHLTPEEFHALLKEDPDAVAVDVRNRYESRIGHFEGAILPPADTFREELPMIAKMLRGKEDKKILLYCTGGIRCEKASSYLKHAGFKNVNQLYGGIIHYAHVTKQKGLKSAFKGKNFVFDDRLSETITPDVLTHCDQCELPCDHYTNCENEMCNRLFIQCQSCALQFAGCCRAGCQKIAALPLEKRRILRKKQKLSPELFEMRMSPL